MRGLEGGGYEVRALSTRNSDELRVNLEDSTRTEQVPGQENRSGR